MSYASSKAFKKQFRPTLPVDVPRLATGNATGKYFPLKNGRHCFDVEVRKRYTDAHTSGIHQLKSEPHTREAENRKGGRHTAERSTFRKKEEGKKENQKKQEISQAII